MNLKRVITYSTVIILLGIISKQTLGRTEIKNKNMEQVEIDNSKKKILARGCDPQLSFEFAKIAPSLTYNAQYIPTTNDQDFLDKLKSQKWSVIYFAPGACRYSAAKAQIPGGISETAGWTLEEYKELIYKYQGDDIQIAESTLESESVKALNKALKNAREVK